MNKQTQTSLNETPLPQGQLPEEIKGHTPGPWKRSETARDCILGNNGGRFTICLMKNTHRAEQQANACLIEAAPGLLQALRDIRDAANDPWKIAEVTKEDYTGMALSKFASRVFSVAGAAIALAESEQGSKVHAPQAPSDTQE